MLTLDIPPGGGSAAHRHPGHHVFGYVLEGSYKIKVGDGAETVLSKGQTFYEAPGQLHAVSANASQTEPAKVLAVLVAESGKPISVRETGEGGAQKKKKGAAGGFLLGPTRPAGPPRVPPHRDLCTPPAMTDAPLTPIEIGLTAAIVAMEEEEPAILVAGEGAKGAAHIGATHLADTRAGLPFGPFAPLAHRTFEIGLGAWVEAQTALAVGYVEQLYTFGDRGRHARPGDTGAHMVSIGYLALTRMPENVNALHAAGAGFEPWYRF